MLTLVRVALLAVLLIAAPAIARAQSSITHAPEVFGSGGVGQLWDDESFLRSALVGGGGVGYRLPMGFAIEGLVDRREHDRRYESGVRFDANVTRVTGRVLHYFGDSAVQPYAGGAVGLAHVRRLNEFPDQCGFGSNGQFQCLSVLVGRSRSTSSVLSGIAGLRMSAGRHVFVRPEFEMGKAGEHLTLGTTFTVGWHW